MKILFFTLFLISSKFSEGQLSNVTQTLSDFSPRVFVDSVQTKLNYFIFDTNKISSIDIQKSTSDDLIPPVDRIYITSKFPGDYNFLSYRDLKEKYFRNTTKPVLLLVNSIFLKNPSAINIDSSFIYNVEVDTGADFEELKNMFSSRTIVNIQTKNGEREHYRPVMMHGMTPSFRKNLE